MSTSESKKTKKPCKILSQECIGTDIYSMWLDAGEIGKNAVPGQFVSLYSRNGGKLLPRPISLCEIDKAEGKLRLVYRVTGKGTGTEEFSRLHAGVPIETMGPLGNGFPLDAVKGKKVFLMGGGIGIPPMLETAKQLDAEKIMVLGYRDELFLNKEFEATEMSMWQQKTALQEQREMLWMPSVRTILRQMRSLPADLPRCSVPSRHMRLKRVFPAGFPWKSAWPVV